MQDSTTHIDKKMTDRGWSAMSQLLDQELPAVQKTRRRFGWWWLALGLPVALISGVLAVKSFTRQTEEKPPVLQTGVPIASLPAVGEAEMAIQQSTPATSGAVPSSNSQVIASNPAVSADPLKNFGKRSTPPTAREAETYFTPKLLPTMVLEKTQPPLSVQELNAETDALAASGLVGKAEPSQHRNAELEKMTALPLVPFAATSGAVPSIPAVLPVDSRWRLSIYGSGLIAPTNIHATGLAAGLKQSLLLKNPRFELEGGAGYAYLQQPLSVIFSSDDVNLASPNSIFTEFNAALGESNISRQNAANQQASARLLKKLQLHYLEVPVAASYRLTSRFSFKAGVNAAILLSSTSDYTTGGVFSKPVDPTGLLADKADASFEYSGEQPTSKLNNFDLAATAGFDYRIHARLTAGFGYQFGMLDLIPRNEIKDFNRLMRVTLRWDLMKGR